MDKNISDAFMSSIKKLVGKKSWSIIAGESTGSHIAVDFGDKILRKNPIKNKHLTEEQRNYIGEFSLYITCSWRLDSYDSVICSSKDSNKKEGPMVKGLRKIVDKKVVSIEILKPAYDLIIYFEDKLSLKIFCDETDIIEDFDNYSFFIPDIIYNVSNRSRLDTEANTI